MALDDDPFGILPKIKPAGHEVGGDLSALSETEIEERIALLEGEIERLKSALAAKRASRMAAENFFKR
ncbi:DUF1192 domain-containing protein [Ancylobacter radicis]|uniref:DUF1192 domain-containing protein n=1 Tax=Ancylobacter radicis TaxID=2836179 RepID=A0ABS5RFR9_9HYPH|nr:DUF1192 domain-containing protein [Ancylobacter radicis]MBS9479187.1 DUF1192 domain-containing protein [Ancylobacter radicis]